MDSYGRRNGAKSARRARYGGGSSGNGQRRAGPGRGVQAAKVARGGFGPPRKGRVKVNKRGGRAMRVGGGRDRSYREGFEDGMSQGLRIGHRM